VYVQSTGCRHPGQRNRSPLFRLTTDHGGMSIGTWLICQRHVLQDRKARLSVPPTGRSSDGRISTDPEHPQTSPV
jgi:hypothetical protein